MNEKTEAHFQLLKDVGLICTWWWTDEIETKQTHRERRKGIKPKRKEVIGYASYPYAWLHFDMNAGVSV